MREKELALDFLREGVLPWKYVEAISFREASGSISQNAPEVGPDRSLACEAHDHESALLHGRRSHQTQAPLPVIRCLTEY
jgi:hypothetical protein